MKISDLQKPMPINIAIGGFKIHTDIRVNWLVTGINVVAFQIFEANFIDVTVVALNHIVRAF